MRNFTTPGILLALLVLLSACSDMPTENKMASAEVVDPDKVTCRSVIKTGTRLGSKVCKTNSSWARDQRDAREAVEAIQSKPKGTTNSGG